MASGTIYGTTSNEYIVSKIEWSSSMRILENASSVTASLYYMRTNEGYTTYGSGTFSISIDGHKFSLPKQVTIGTSWVKVHSHTVTISHQSNGKKSITISASGSISGTTLTSTTCSGTAVLDTIPREMEFNSLSCSTKYFTGVLTYKYTVTNPDFYNRCVISLNLDGTNVEISNVYMGKEAALQRSRTVSFSSIQLSDTIYPKLTHTTVGVLRFTLRTYSDSGYSQEIGSGTYKEITLSIPETNDTKPTVSMTISSVSDLPSPYDSLYIQGHSKLKATVVPNTKCGATVEASSITVNGNTYDSPYESDILSQAGKVSVKATVKDSRGFYGTYYKDIEVIPYEKPYVRAKSGETSIIAARCDSSANFTDSGTYLKIKAKIVYSKVVSGGSQKNYGFIKFRYRHEGGAYTEWQTILDCKTDNSDEVITPPLLNGALDIKVNYQVQIIACDDLYESVPITFVVPSDEVYMDRPAGGKSMGLGGYSTGDDRLDVYWKTMARGGLSLFDAGGNEIPIVASAVLNPHDQLAAGWNPDALANGVYAVSGSKPLMVGTNVIMRNGVLIQMSAYSGGDVKIQLALTSDEDKNPYYRVHWYGNWGNWRSFKL